MSIKWFAVFRKKTTYILFLAFVLFLFALFRHSFIGYGINLAINSYFPKKNGLKCEFTNVRLKNKQLVFKDLHFFSYEDSNHYVDIYVEQCALGFTFTLRSFELKPLVEMIKPKLHIKTAVQKSTYKNSIASTLHKIARGMNITVKEGQMFLYRKDKKLKCYFDYEESTDPNFLSFLSFYQSPKHLQPDIHMAFSMLQHELLTHIDINDVDPSWFVNLLTFFSSADALSWESTSGECNATALLSITKAGELSRFDANIATKNLSLVHPEKDWKFACDSCMLCSSYPIYHDQKFFAKERWWNYLMIDTQIEKGYMHCVDFDVADLNGAINLNTKKASKLFLTANLVKDNFSKPLRIKGIPCMDPVHLLAVEISTDPLNSKHSSVTDVQITQTENGSVKLFADIQYLDVQFLQLIQLFRKEHRVNFISGYMQGGIHADFDLQGNYHIDLENLSLNHLQVDLLQPRGILFCSSLHFNGDISYEKHKLNISKLHLGLETGDFCFKRRDGHSDTLSSMAVDIHIENNQFLNSQILGKISQANAKVELNSNISSPDVKASVLAPKRVLEDFFKIRLKKSLSNISICDELYIQAKISNHKQNLKIDGKLELENELEESQQIQFGFDLEKFSFMPSKPIFASDLLSKISNGWFKGKKLAHQVYQPLITLRGMPWQLFGYMDVEGIFNSKYMSMNFCSNHLTYRSKEVDIIVGDWSKRHIKPNLIKGEVRYDFANDWFFADIPFTDAKCLQKENMLEFEHLMGHLQLNGPHMVISNISGISKEGIKVHGEMLFHFIDIDVDTMQIHVDHFEGNTQQLFRFAKHFPEVTMQSFPFEGKFESGPGGLNLFTRFLPNIQEPVWDICLKLFDGKYVVNEHMSLQDTTSTLYFDSDSKTTKIFQTKAHIYVDDIRTNYNVALPYFHCSLANHLQLTSKLLIDNGLFDVACFDLHSHRFEGATYISLNNQTSHIRNVAIDQFQLAIDDHLSIKGCEIDCNIPIKDLVQTADTLSKWGLCKINPYITEKSLYQASGNLHINGKINHLLEGNFHINSDAITVFNIPFACVDIHIVKTEDQWQILNSKIGDYQISMQGCGVDIFHFSNLVVQHNESLIDCSGSSIDFYNKKIHVPIQKAIILRDDVLDKLKQMRTKLPKSVISWLPSLGLKGDVSLTVGEDNCELDSNVIFYAHDSPNFGYLIKTAKPMHLSYQNQSISIKDLTLDFQQMEKVSRPISIKLDHVKVPLDDLNQIEVSKGSAMIPHEGLYNFMETIFKMKIFQDLQSIDLNRLKYYWNNDTQFDFSFTLNPSRQVEISLSEEEYLSFGKTFHISNHILHLDDDRCFMKFNTKIEDQNIEIFAQYFFDGSKDVQLHIKNPDKESECIYVKGKFTQDDIFLPSHIYGKLSGLDVDLIPKYDKYRVDPIVLTGKLVLDIEKMTPLLPQWVFDRIRWLNIQNFIEVCGDIVIKPQQLHKSFFDGYIRARELGLGGCLIRNVLGRIYLKPGKVTIHDLKICDQAGLINLPYMQVKQVHKNDWHLELPKLEMLDIKPALLRKAGIRKRRLKPLSIHKFIFENINGSLNDLSSIEGSGHLEFLNTLKREYTILDIPLEIISRLGLDMKLLVPSKGEVIFHIENQKFYIDELKETYSEGKRSLFFLSKKTPSYIDFQGNLHLDVKMKQNVLLKLTQLFMLSIRGNVVKPEFSLK